ncbi:MAG: DNA-processing protein DprA, partial [Pseudomonadota bacterium]
VEIYFQRLTNFATPARAYLRYKFLKLTMAVKELLAERRTTKPQHNDELVATIRLLLTDNIGPATYFDLLKIYGSAANICQALAKSSPTPKNFKLASLATAKKEIDNTLNYGACLIHINDPLYPTLLKNIYNPPPVLTALGNLDLLSRPTVSIVGARAASANSINLTQQIAAKVSDEGYVTVSGLAIGIDTAVHQASIAGGTVVVLANGIDVSYPPENNQLRQQIIKNGLILTEMPFGTQVSAKLFPRRNRIISGLSPLSVVIEATMRSGTLHTANYALSQNRMVAAIPGSPLDPRTRGNNHLLKQGAHLVENANDILNLLQSQPKLNESGNNLNSIPSKTDVNLAAFVDRQDIDDAKTKITSLLDLTPIDFDQLAKFVNIPMPTTLMAIVELELEEKIMRHYGNRFSLHLNIERMQNYDPEYEEECL